MEYEYGMDTFIDSPGQAAIDSIDEICQQNFTMSLNETVWNGYHLCVSRVVARLPIVAITHSNTYCPRLHEVHIQIR